MKLKVRYIQILMMLLGGYCYNAIAQNTNTWGQWETWGDQANGFYKNPILPADFSDIDCIKVGKEYYAISSTFQFSPGMIILHSRDLVNWKVCGHAIEDITQITPELNWDRMNRYSRGVWAGSIRYYKGTFYLVFGTPDEGYFITSSCKPEGPWKPLCHLLKEDGWDDCCIDWDEEGNPFFVGTNFKDGYKTYLFRMSKEMNSINMESAILINSGNHREANKLLSKDGWHYLIFSEYVPENGRYVMAKRSKKIEGPYKEERQLTRNVKGSNEPNQGGIIKGSNGKWYFLTHHGDGDWAGRVMSLLPVTWVDGWPIIGKIETDGIGVIEWEGKMPAKSSHVSYKVYENFESNTISKEMEWNYQPRKDKYSLKERKGWLRLKAFKTINSHDILSAGNTLTLRTIRTKNSEISTRIDLSGLVDNEHCGLCHFSKSSASMGVTKENGKIHLETSVNGKWIKGELINSTVIWIKSCWGQDGKSHFYYSIDGKAFIPYGTIYQLQWGNYRGDRIGIFNFNDEGDNGFVDFDFIHYNFQ